MAAGAFFYLLSFLFTAKVSYLPLRTAGVSGVGIMGVPDTIITNRQYQSILFLVLYKSRLACSYSIDILVLENTNFLYGFFARKYCLRKTNRIVHLMERLVKIKNVKITFDSAFLLFLTPEKNGLPDFRMIG